MFREERELGEWPNGNFLVDSDIFRDSYIRSTAARPKKTMAGTRQRFRDTRSRLCAMFISSHRRQITESFPDYRFYIQFKVLMSSKWSSIPRDIYFLNNH
jgi:hypothetical protein